MADFLDFDSLELNVDEQVNGAKEHPLKGMKTGAKMAYVGGLLFACHADDNTLQKEERSLVMGVAHSLGVGKEEVDELAETIVGLTDKIGYLKEIVATLKDRKTILFFLCDMIKAMGADGVLNENAQKLIGAVEKLARLDEHDVTFVSGFEKFIFEQVSADNSSLTGMDMSGEVDESLVSWFAPSLFMVLKATKGDGEKELKEGKEGANCKKNTGRKKAGGTLKKNSRKRSESESCQEQVEESAPVRVFDSGALIDATMQRFVADFQEKSSTFSPCIFYGGTAPTKKMINAMHSMQIQEVEYLFQFDNTSFGSAKEGVVITGKAFYFKNIMEDPVRIVWENMPDDSWVSGTDMYLGEYKVDLNWMGSETAEAFAVVLNGLVKKLREEVNVIAHV